MLTHATQTLGNDPLALWFVEVVNEILGTSPGVVAAAVYQCGGEMPLGIG